MAEALRIEQIRAGRPMAVFVGEDAVENENLLSIRMVVRRECRARLVADDGGNLPSFRRADPMNSLAPDRPAGTRRPFHLRGVDDDADGEISVNRLDHGVLPGRQPEPT